MDNKTPNSPLNLNAASVGMEVPKFSDKSEKANSSDFLPSENLEQQIKAAAPQEIGPSNSGEQANQNPGMMLPMVVAPDPVVDDSTAVQPISTTTTSADDSVGPAKADDVDIVEKEWVDRAKQIVEEHRDDPHKQEQEVEKLQTDYLKKRYGKEIKTSDV